MPQSDPSKCANSRPPDSPILPCSGSDPACCGKTCVTIKCSHAGDRGYFLTLPFVNNKPKDVRKREGAYLEVISTFDAQKNCDKLTIESKGPAECPPGKPNLVEVCLGTVSERFPVGTKKEVETHSSVQPLPVLPKELADRLFSDFAPWRWHNLPVVTGTVDGISCKDGKTLHADIFVFPRITCSASGDLEWKRDKKTKNIEPEGNAKIAVEYNGGERSLDLKWIKERIEGKSLISWKAIKKVLDDLHEGWSLAAQKGGAGTPIVKLPKVGVSGTAELAEKKSSPDVLSKYSFTVTCDPLIELGYEYNIVPWIVGAVAGTLTANPLAGFVARKFSEKFLQMFDAGIFLGVTGKISFSMQVDSAMLKETDTEVGTGKGSVTFKVEARAKKDYKGVFVEAQAAASAKADSAINVSGKCLCKLDPESHRWSGTAGWGGLLLKSCYSYSAKVFLFGSSEDEDAFEVQVFEPVTWWDSNKPRSFDGPHLA